MIPWKLEMKSWCYTQMDLGPRGWKGAWTGPFVVEQVLSPVSFKLNTPGKRSAVMHRNHLKRYIRSVNINHVILVDGDLDNTGQLELPGLAVGGDVELTEEAKRALESLSDEQKSQLDDLLQQFKPTFSTTPGLTKLMSMSIDMGGNKPTNIPPYRIPVRWRQKLEGEIQQLLDLGMIRASRSAWAAPVVCVAKTDGSLRMCVDYRALNATTAPDMYPMPRIEEMLNRVAPAKFITTLDLCKGYYQVPLSEPDVKKTAFITPSGKYEFLRVLFGLRNASALFQ